MSVQEELSASELFDIKGRVAIVTGAASGLGYAFAAVLAANGAQVTLIDRDPATLDEAVSRLADQGGTVSGVAVDVTDRAGLRTAIDAVVDRAGRVDIVFANAGIAAGPGFMTLDGERDPKGALEGIPDELWDQVLDTNLTSVFTTIRAAAPHMKRQGYGRIVAISSVSSLVPGGLVGSAYGVSKAGINQLVRQSAMELARFGVTVNAVCPGPFVTPLTSPELEAAFLRNAPSHRVAQVREIQGLALFLASANSAYVTGTHIVIDGGRMLGRPD
ncbi:D-beta-hydroxybutyrate dehydrogenase (plasmid) [Sulfitobacter sp. THAF37]|uniref:SDR family NAD(P)-dependent oxidoreductase n=1 Tax=Sulfitobacter sp. THAF37 TaxID=2587855 RepID=UPI0012694F97|nr:SDR family NAD(P)-dependent oxidoreductase [Sulfitobacter sp. THAF37]QFT60875.1 D-beta-hydroxybutyrate dehydrogenase [Sulfitobacter sp. THAF37]